YKYERLIKNVLNNVLIFKDYQTALRYKNLLFDGWRIVTLQGEVFLPNGTVSGGFRFGVEATLNTEKAIIETEERINDLLESNKFLEKDIEKLKIEIEKNKNIAQKIDGVISKIKTKIVDKEKEISMLQDRVTLYREYEKEGKVLLNRYEELLKEIEREEKEIDAFRKDYESKRIKKIELEKDLNSLNKDLENLKYRLEEIEKEKDRIIKENEMLTQMFQKCVEEYKEKEANKEVLLIENKDLLEKSEKIRKEIKKLEKEWQKLREEEIILEQREKELTNRIKEVQASLEENFEENLVLKIDLSEEELKRLEIEIVKELESLGPVNFLAKAKLEEEEKKYNFLVSQIEDVSESIKSLKKVIRDTKEEAERRFIDTFREFKIKANYNWKLFFPNAELDLFLENEENILASNIKLRISSQKKNWKNMLMLSGGEKSLVGISLLLSAVELASVDFCFWDEIDAALDNQNAQILGKKIKELSRKKQLILISHNPVLMQYADIIYGVTLNDKGSSQVLSWKMTEEVSN
ncbi:MAG: chromosome segregation protein SMC, partial [Dictyoglomus sp.]